MNVDCQWISKNLEALFSDGLTAEQDLHARAHIEDCTECRSEIQAIHAIDPLIKKYFRQQMAIAQAPKRARPSVIYGGAATVLAAILLAVIVGVPTLNRGASSPPSPSEIAPSASLEAPPTIKTDVQGDVRTKPQPAAPGEPLPKATAAAPAADANALEFLVTDPAGYSHSLNDYRGHVLLIGVWSSGQPASIANLERLYKSFASNTKLRFIGVSNGRQSKPAGTTFPIVYNQGSKLLGAMPGEFVLLDEAGSVLLRGSLVKDYNTLRKLLQGE